METPSKSSSSLSRMALGALDANSQLIGTIASPRTSAKAAATPNKPAEPSRKGGMCGETGEGNLYKLREGQGLARLRVGEMQTPAPALPAPQRAMFGLVGETGTGSGSAEKRKEAPTSSARMTADAERAVKQARFSQAHSRQSSVTQGRGHSRQSSASGHAHTLFGEITSRKGEEGVHSSQDTMANSSFNDGEMGIDDAEQLSSLEAPDLGGSSPTPEQRMPESLRQTANALKLRLQFAMYKLQTHQEHIPLRHVRIVERRPRFPQVVGSPGLSTAREWSRHVSPVLREGQDASAAPRGGEGGRGELGSGGLVLDGEGADDTEEEEEAGEGEGEMVSPVQRPVAWATEAAGGGEETRGGMAAGDAPGREDRLLSLVDAIEVAGKQGSRL